MKKDLLRLTYFSLLLFTNASVAQVQWVNRFNGQGDFTDRFTMVKIDNSNNIILAGFTNNPGNNQDILLVKLNSLGDTIFKRTYNGPGNGADDALAMALDAAGSIYLTGFERGSGTGNDFLTMKYDASGNLLWVATYNYPTNEYDQSNSIAVDASGNVYISGQSDSDPTGNNNDDYVTIKYDALGNQQWAIRKNGLGNGPDRPAKVLVDNSGNVYVTGRSFNGSDDDYLTIKYNSTGAEQWVKLFDRTHNDRPVDMVLDNANSLLYVTGRSTNGTNYDYATLKYNLAGTELWNRIYDYVDDDRATAMALDASGNIYVTGQSDTVATAILSYNITTLKYDSAGTLLWTRSVNGSANNDDIPNFITADNSGNVYIAGQTDADATTAINWDYILLKYNSSGTFQWSHTFNGSLNAIDIGYAVAVDNSGHPVITGYDDSQIPQRNCATLKYDSTGSLAWSKFYDGQGDNSDNSHAICVDNFDNVYVAGYSVSYNSDRNFLVLKLDPAGDTAWTRQLNGTASGSIDEAQAIVTDNSYIYATGYIKNSSTSSDYTTVKYNSAGDTMWVRYFNDYIFNQSDRAYAIGLDASGNVYVTGRSDTDPTTASSYDIVTIKYDNNGNQQWAIHYNGPGNGNDEATLLKVSPTGNIYVAGKTFNGTDDDYLVIKYNSAGAQQWVATFNSGYGDDEAHAMMLDNNGNVYFTGYSANVDGIHRDLTTVRINSSGGQTWARTYNGTANGDDEGKGIALDAGGNVIVSGYTDSDAYTVTLNNDYVTVKYDSTGAQQWVMTYDGSANANDEANDVVVDASDNIYVTGQSDNGTPGNQNYDYVTIRYLPNGTSNAVNTYNGTANGSDVANTITINSNFLYVTGGSYGPASQRDLVTIKYVLANFTLAGTIDNTSPDFMIYPDPLTDNGIIKFSELPGENYSLQITDLAGKELSSTNVNGLSSMSISHSSLSNGIYCISLKQNDKILRVKKLIIQ